MGDSSGRLLPVLLASALVMVLLFGCIQQPSGTTSPEDGFGKDAEALNLRIAAAATPSGVSELGSEVSALRDTAENDSRLSKYVPLLEAQGLTLDVLRVYMEFKSEGASLGTSGIDCGKDYSGFIARLRSANATAQSAISKASAYGSANPDSAAPLLISAINNADPESMSAYAGILAMEIPRTCLEATKPAKEYPLPLSGADALEIASGLAGAEYFVYGLDSPLPSKTVVTAPRAMGDQNFTVAAETWFFFLDREPWAPFGHDVKYVMIDADSADYTVSNETMYPIIGGEIRWKSIDERMDPANVLFPFDAAEYLTTPANLSGEESYFIRTYPLAGPSAASAAEGPICCPEKKKFALILTGSNDSMFQADTERMYGHLKAAGYSDGEITYLAAKADAAGSDSVTSVPGLASALGNLSANAKCCDEIFIYLAGHGSQDKVWEYKHKTTGEKRWIRRLADLGASPADYEATGKDGYYHKLDVLGGYASSEALSTFIKGMKSCKITIIYQSCFSGAAAPTLAFPGVSVLAPVDSGHSSYGVNSAGGEWGVGSFFSQAYINAKGSANASADANHDGTVSEKEAFDYADKKNHDEMESRRRYWKDKADAEANATKKARFQAKADGIQEQNGVFKEGGPCWCCSIQCNESTSWLCTIVDGKNMQNSSKCAGKKIGDYCGPVTVIPPANDTPPHTGNDTNRTQTGGNTTTGTGGNTSVGTGGGNETAGGNQTGGNITAVCGDGKKTGGEGCDYGSPDTNKCEAGYYCHDSCVCKKLETGVICGDGKISVPNEECDGGSVKFNTCSPGFSCKLCKCVPVEAACGDGTVTPPEECDHGNTYTEACYGGKTCSSCKCYDTDDVPEATHKACSGTSCVTVSGAGSDQCSTDSQCAQAAPTHKVCSGASCVSISGSGSDQCSSDAQCTSAPTPYCGDGSVNGNEECDGSGAGCDGGGACSSGCKCVYPPTLNCDYVCSLTSGTQAIASGLGSEPQCQSAASSFFTSRTCFTTCKYSWFYRVDNIAGFASCCCGIMKEFACSDCPGENPTCPAAGTVCPANAPSWQSPP